tara:strand:+ start:1892 stop:2392 length:501 start_codon:yes stop_codon:yes gene_type:complete
MHTDNSVRPNAIFHVLDEPSVQSVTFVCLIKSNINSNTLYYNKMGFTDKMCYDVARNIIEDMFIVKYIPTIVEGISWYVNLNNFLFKQYTSIENIEEDTKQFTVKEERAIISDAMQILLDNLGITENEREDHENDIDWERFDSIISHYICQYKPKMYGVDGKELQI